MNSTLLVVLTSAIIIAIIIIAKNKALPDRKKEKHNNVSEITDEEIIEEILNFKEISLGVIEGLPWKNRKYKNYSSEKLKEMHAKFMNDTHAARIDRDDNKVLNIEKKIGDVNAELMIRNQIQIHRASRIPIDIGNPNDEGRLRYLLEEKIKNYQYKVLADEGLFNYESVVKDRVSDLKQNYIELGYDESNAILLAKCELLGIKIKSEPEPTNG